MAGNMEIEEFHTYLYFNINKKLISIPKFKLKIPMRNNYIYNAIPILSKRLFFGIFASEKR